MSEVVAQPVTGVEIPCDPTNQAQGPEGEGKNRPVGLSVDGGTQRALEIKGSLAGGGGGESGCQLCMNPVTFLQPRGARSPPDRAKASPHSCHF